MRLRLEIRGRVQGVWFRASARQEALRLGLLGWARNQRDGSVEILAEGAPAAMKEFVAWCHRGPAAAQVVSVRQSEEQGGESLCLFDVRHRNEA